MMKLGQNAGTQVLKQVRLQGPVDWKKKYGDELKYIITLVAGGNNGAVYKADNWKEIGKTAGLPKERKTIYFFCLAQLLFYKQLPGLLWISFLPQLSQIRWELYNQR